MRVKTTMALVLMLALGLTTIGKAENVLNYVSSVDIYVDGFICATCVSTMENNLRQEENVVSVDGDLGKGVLHVIPKMDGSHISLYNLEQRINNTIHYTVIEMGVVAAGKVVKFPAEYYIGGQYAYSGDRYKLQAGKTEFILAKNKKLTELLNSGYKTVSVEGTVTSFRARIPIMEIQSFKGTLGEAKSVPESQEMVPERIDSVQIYVDGDICASCTRILKSALTVEEGVANVDVNQKTGVVTVTPKTEGLPVNLADLWDQVNANREYTTRKMDVTAIGHLTITNMKYFSDREYTHSHDRYILQIGSGDTHFILSENKMLYNLIDSGYKKVRVRGIVSAFSAKAPIMLIGEFGPAGEKIESVKYIDPLKTSPVDEKKLMEGNEHRQIDSIRIYIDGFICAACEQPLQNDVLKEEGVEIVSTAPELGMIEVTPKNLKSFALHDLWSRINATREYKVLKMDVVASGKLVDRDIVYGQGTFDQETVKRYMLFAGKNIRFILSENENLEKMVKSGDKAFVVVGTITNFNSGVDPVLEVNNYEKLEKLPEWLKMIP